MGDFTYEYLFDVVRKERSREEIQELSPTFYADATSYLQELSTAITTADPLESHTEQQRTQLHNSKKLLKELYERREKKIVHLALNKARTGSELILSTNLLEEENGLYAEILERLLTYRATKKIITHIPERPTKTYVRQTTVTQEPKRQEEPKTVAEGMKIKITASIPRFLGANQETYGPYEAGNEVHLPERIAQILIKKGRAEEA